MTTPITDEERTRRQVVLESSLATVGLEGLFPDQVTQEAAYRWAAGKITLEELMRIATL